MLYAACFAPGCYLALKILLASKLVMPRKGVDAADRFKARKRSIFSSECATEFCLTIFACSRFNAEC